MDKTASYILAAGLLGKMTKQAGTGSQSQHGNYEYRPQTWWRKLYYGGAPGEVANNYKQSLENILGGWNPFLMFHNKEISRAERLQEENMNMYLDKIKKQQAAKPVQQPAQTPAQ